MMAGLKEGIAERKLRPLWDAIDSRQFKSALKLVTGLLTKYAGSAYLLALKGLILERMGKADEALALCQQSKDSGPDDELTLNTLQMVYSRLERLDLTTSCYEYATSKHPDKPEYLTWLFNCYAREYKYVKQQHAAMKLYKLVGSEKYLLWAVCSIQLQVRCGDGKGVQLLPLAEALIKKRIESHGLKDLKALLVYVTVLREQQKFGAALEAISGPLGALFTIPVDKLLLQGEILMESCQYRLAASVFKEVLKLCSDDWDAFLCLLSATLEESAASSAAGMKGMMSNGVASMGLKIEEVMARLEEVDAFVEELVAMEVPYLRRGPYLSKVEIAKRRLLFQKHYRMSDAEILNGERALTDCLVQYFERFGHMVSFASDVKGFVCHIADKEKERLASSLHSMSSNLKEDNPVNDLRRRIAAYQVEEMLSVKATVPNEALFDHAVRILKLYVDNLNLSVKLDPQESVFGEELLTLAVNVLVELFRRTQELGYLIEAILILEFGLSLRKHTSQYKLQLINLYCLLSAGELAVRWYKTLDIKFILLDTLSHHVLYYLLNSPLWSELESLLKSSIKFHVDHELEAAEHTLTAYQKGTYSKVLEYVQFKEKLRNSCHYLTVRIEDSILSLKKESTVSGLISTFAKLDFGCETYRLATQKTLSTLTFLEDFQTRPWWSPAPDECYLTGFGSTDVRVSWHYEDTEEDKRRREDRRRMGTRKRALLPCLLYLSLNAALPRDEKSAHESSDVPTDLRLLLDEYSKVLGVCRENLENLVNEMIKSKRFVEETGLSVVDLLSFGVFSAALDVKSHVSQLERVEQSLEGSFESLMRAIKATLDGLLGSISCGYSVGKADSLVEVMAPGFGVSVLMHLTSEVLAWLSLCLQSWLKHVQPIVKKKKKAGVASIHSSEELSERKVSSILNELQKLQTCLSLELERLISVLTSHLEKPEEEEVRCLFMLLKQRVMQDGELNAAPGLVFQTLLSQKVKLEIQSKWQPESVLKHIVSSQRTSLDGVRDLATKQLRNLRVLKV